MLHKIGKKFTNIFRIKVKYRFKEINRSFAERLLSKNKEKWETIPSFYSEVDNLREIKYQDDEEMLELIEQYNQYVMEIESKLESA